MQFITLVVALIGVVIGSILGSLWGSRRASKRDIHNLQVDWQSVLKITGNLESRSFETVRALDDLAQHLGLEYVHETIQSADGSPKEIKSGIWRKKK